MFLTEKDASSKAASKEDEGTGDEDRTDNSESLSSQDEGAENQEKPKEKDPDEDEHVSLVFWLLRMLAYILILSPTPPPQRPLRHSFVLRIRLLPHFISLFYLIDQVFGHHNSIHSSGCAYGYFK